MLGGVVIFAQPYPNPVDAVTMANTHAIHSASHGPIGLPNVVARKANSITMMNTGSPIRSHM